MEPVPALKEPGTGPFRAGVHQLLRNELYIRQNKSSNRLYLDQPAAVALVCDARGERDQVQRLLTAHLGDALGQATEQQSAHIQQEC